MYKKIIYLIALSFCFSLHGIDPINTTIFGDLAVKGYDTVSYFKTGKAEKGSKKYSYQFMEVNWRFSSKENLNLFKANPEKYMPQYGGYCSWAVSEGYTANIDPEAWKIVEGKLYLNYNQDIQKKWESDSQQNIEKANANWPKILNKK